jgi:TPR repeat protein/TolB-like protein
LKCCVQAFLSVVGLWWAWTVHPAPPSTDSPNGPTNQIHRISVAILGFENRTQNPELDFWRFGLEGLVVREVRQIRAVHLSPHDAVRFGLREAAKKPDDGLTSADAQKAGESIEARRVVWGSYDQDGEKWKVSGKVLNVATGAVLVEFAAISTNWFEIGDRVADEILAALHVTPSDDERAKMKRRSIGSLDALKWVSKAAAVFEGRASASLGEDFARRAIGAEPDGAAGFSLLATCLGNEGKHAEAEEAAVKATRLDPEYSNGHLILANALARQDRMAESEAAAKLAANLAPDDAGPIEFLAQIHRANPSASEEFKRAMELDPYSASIHAELGIIHAGSGRREEALAELKESQRFVLDSDVNSELYMSEGYAALHETPAAIFHLQRFIAAAKQQGVDVKAIKDGEKELVELERRLTPAYFKAAEPRAYSPEELQTAFKAKLSSEELAVAVNPFDTTTEMIAWAHELTRDATNDLQKARMLFDAQAKRINPAQGGARTAEEAFAVWNKSDVPLRCQEHANLYVALARAAGLKSYFVAVEQAADGRKGAHACAALFIDGSMLLVDPTYYWFGAPHKEFTVLDDLQAAALHLSQLTEGGGPELEAAYKLAPNQSGIQLNYGHQLMNRGRWDEARSLLAAIQNYTNHWMSAMIEAQLLAHDHKLDRALQVLRQTVDLNPDVGEVRIYLGYIYATLDQLKEARDALREGLKRPLYFGDAESARRVAAQGIAAINEKLGDERVGWPEAPASAVADVERDREGAKSGDTAAMERLGYRYETGIGVAKDTGEAIRWYQAAATAGNSEAMARLGAVYRQGTNGQPDFEKAYEWSRKAADAGSANGMRDLGFCYVEGKGIRKDPAEGARWVRMAAEKGNVLAMTQLGWLFEYGRGVEKDYVQAMLWYRKAADKGESTAMAYIGEMYRRGEAVDRSDSQAARWYQKAADAGSVPAMYSLGMAYAAGNGVEKDAGQALRWLMKAADSGHADSMFYLGSMYLNGRGVVKDAQLAIEWYRKAGKAGNSAGYYGAAHIYIGGAGVPVDNEKAMELLKKGAEAGNSDSVTAMGDIYRDGRGVEKNDAEAIRWYQRGVEMGNTRAMTDLGRMCEEGRIGPRNLAAARTWYRKAIAAGDKDAKERLEKIAEKQ